MARITKEGKYPPGVEWYEYTKVVGAYGTKSIVSIIKEFDYEVVIAFVEANGVDIWVRKNGFLVLVIENKNLRNTSYLKEDKMNSIKKNFKNYNVPRLLITSFNDKRFNSLKEEGISVIVTGMNILPDEYFEYYDSLGMADSYGMVKFDETTKQRLREILSEYLKENNI